MNGRNHGRRCDRSGIGESIEQDLQTEVMVTMSMGYVNGHEILASLDEPIHPSARLLSRQKRVDEYRVTLAMNKRHRVGYPRKMLLAGGESLK